MLIGGATQNLSGSDWPSTWGPLTCRRSFNGAGDFSSTHGVPPTFAASNAHIDPGLDLVTIYSFKPDITLMSPDSNGNSSLDGAVNGFLDSIPEGHKAILTIWHEGDGKVRSGMFTVAQWRAAVGQFIKLVNEHANPDIIPAIILEAYQPTAPGTHYSDMWVDGAALLLVDGYTDLGQDPEAIWGAAKAAAAEFGVGWGITEIGTRSGTVDPVWMAKNAAWAHENDAVCLCWFNSTSGGVVATPGTGAGPVAATMAISTVLYSDPGDFTN